MRTDYIYGWKAIEEGNGFTAAQASMNIPETLFYILYLWIVYTKGIKSEVPSPATISRVYVPRCLHGMPGAWAVVMGFAAATMTFSKTALYGESSFDMHYFGWYRLRLQGSTRLSRNGVMWDTMSGVTCSSFTYYQSELHYS